MSESGNGAVNLSASGSYSWNSNAGGGKWMDDSASDSCMKCHTKFSGFRRRKHHCRLCGELVCSACAKTFQVVPHVHPTTPQRVCYICAGHPVPASTSSPSLSAQETAQLTRSITGRKPVLIQQLAEAVPPNFDRSRVYGALKVRVVEARGLIAADTNLMGKLTTSDPYCVLRISDGPSVRTRTLPKTLDPRWDEAVDFLLSRADPILHLTCYDEDTLNADDPLGSCEIPLGDLHPNGSPFRGWFPLEPPEENPGPAGALYLELQLGITNVNKHLVSYVSPPEPPPQTPAPFDIDAIYAPGMHIKDLLWDRCMYHVICEAVGVVFWNNPKKSGLILVGFNVATSYLKHWPAGTLAALIAYMLKQRSLKNVDAKQLSDEPTKVEEQHLGGVVRSAVKSGIPEAQKELCIFLAPLMRMGADLLQKIRDVMTWEDAASPHVAGALSVGVIMCELFSFSTVLKLLGSSVLLACSPVLKAAIGLVAYLKWKRADPKTSPISWQMTTSFDERTLSTQASASVRAVGRKWKETAHEHHAAHEPIALSAVKEDHQA